MHTARHLRTRYATSFAGHRGRLHLLLQDRNDKVNDPLRLTDAEMRALAAAAQFRDYRSGENMIDRGETCLKKSRNRLGTNQPLRLFFPLMAYRVRVIESGQQVWKDFQPGDFTGDRAARVDPIVFTDEWDPTKHPITLTRTNPVQAKVNGASAVWDMNLLPEELRDKLRTICDKRSAQHRRTAAPPGDERGELPTGSIKALDAGWQDPDRTIDDGPTEEDTMDHDKQPVRRGILGWLVNLGSG